MFLQLPPKCVSVERRAEEVRPEKEIRKVRKMKRKETNMSAYSQAANGFVVSERVTLMLDMLDDDARARVLNQAYQLARGVKCAPLEIEKENMAATSVALCAMEIAKAFRKRQKQSREARQVGAANREIVVRASNDNREMVSEERREEEVFPTPLIEEESKEDKK